MPFKELHTKLKSDINTSEKAEAGVPYLDVETHFGTLTDCFWPPCMPRRDTEEGSFFPSLVWTYL